MKTSEELLMSAMRTGYERAADTFNNINDRLSFIYNALEVLEQRDDTTFDGALRALKMDADYIKEELDDLEESLP